MQIGSGGGRKLGTSSGKYVRLIDFPFHLGLILTVLLQPSIFRIVRGYGHDVEEQIEDSKALAHAAFHAYQEYTENII